MTEETGHTHTHNIRYILSFKYWPEINDLKSIFFSQNESVQNQQKIVIQGLQPWWAMCKFPYGKGEKKSFYKREKGKWEIYWKQRVHDFSLAQSLSGKKSSFSSSSWARLSSQGRRAPHSGPSALSNWVFCSKIFT